MRGSSYGDPPYGGNPHMGDPHMTIAKYPEHRVYLSAADFRGFFRGFFRGSSAKLPRNFRDTVFLRNLLFGMSGHVCLILSGLVPKAPWTRKLVIASAELPRILPRNFRGFLVSFDPKHLPQTPPQAPRPSLPRFLPQNFRETSA